MKRKLLLLILLISNISFAQGPTDYSHRYEFDNTLNNTQGGNQLSGASASPSYFSDRFNTPQEALNPNANRLESIVLNSVSDVSISFWIKAPASTTAGDIVSLKNSDTNNQGRMILSKGNNNRLIATFTSRNANPSAFSTSTVFDDNWHHIVFTTRRTANSHQNFVFVDGSGSLNQNINPSVSNELFMDDAILAIAGGNQFNGVIDDLRVYDRELSFTEVNAIYNSFVNIPDTNFKAELVNNSNINTDGDSEISYLEAQAFTGTIDVPFKNISDLTGIGAFPNISILYVNNNQLTSLDVSNNLSLETIYFSDNSITQADLSLNTNLTRVYAFNNQLTSLNVANGNNSNFTAMRAQGNANACIQHDTNFSPNNNWIRDTSASWSTNCPAAACTSIVNIPDVNFKNALLAHGTTITGASISVIDTDGDGEICTTEATAYTGFVNVNSQSINDLTGLSAFTNATVLDVSFNSVSTLDVSMMSNLISLFANDTQLSNLDVSSNLSLEDLFCRNNSISALDVSFNALLTDLDCGFNNLTSLNVSSNSALRLLRCNNNQLTGLDLSANPQLALVQVNSNDLSSFNVANGNNTNINYLTAVLNPNLSCIQHDSGFTPPPFSNPPSGSPSGWQKDSSATWNDNCSTSSCASIVNIPDANFKSALLAHGTTITGGGISVIDTDSDGEICTTEASAYTGEIKVNNRSIANMTGIEAFTNITKLTAWGNPSITSLDISNNTLLESLLCFNTSIGSLDISTNSALVELDCTNSQLSTLNVSSNTLLEVLKCGINPLTVIDVSSNTALRELACGASQISTLDLTSNINLEILNVPQTALTSLDVSNLSNLRNLNCSQISTLTSLNVANGNNGNNTSQLNNLDARYNQNLSCIQHDTGFDPTTVSGWQKDASATWNTNCNLSINDYSFDNGLSLYPNPATNIVNISSTYENISKIEVFSSLGKKILETEQLNIDISMIKNGIYFLRIESEMGKTSIRKIVKL